jgi:predicted ATPase/class 3 adenylate cyclase
MPDLPIGTITFLLTDIEGSTTLWEQEPDVMGAAVARHDALLTASIEAHEGVVVRSRGEGDSFFAVFARASDAVVAACALQQALAAEEWPGPTPIRARAGLHTGEAELREGDYYGSAVNRCARLRALAHGGQAVLSQPTYELVRDALPEGLGLRALGAHRLKDLQRPEQVYQILHPELLANFPPLKSLDVLPNNLPLQLTSFVGREAELGELRNLLVRDGTRLVTLTGPGGTGKTRLSLQAAGELVEEYLGGVWFVPLAALREPALVPAEIAQALRLPPQEEADPLARIIRHLRNRPALLILDNFEQLTAAAPLVQRLLMEVPGLQCLVTSRERLHLAAEQEFPVEPLPLPSPQTYVTWLTELRHAGGRAAIANPSVQLFQERARAARPDFAVTAENADAIAQLCCRLEGIPLAIELAAARVRVLSPPQILSRLIRRFDLLAGGSRDLPDRQRTLRAAVDWSYDLLTEAERRFFASLSIFAGGFTLEAAEAVTADLEAFELLSDLRDKSLVAMQEASVETRFRLLETLREYAAEKLSPEERERLGRAHAEYYLEFARERVERQQGAEQGQALAELATELDNLRAGMDWAEARDENELLGSYGFALRNFFYARSQGGEGLARIRAAADALRAVGNAERLADLLNKAGLLAYRLGELPAAEAHYDEALAIYRQIGAARGQASVLNNLGNIADRRGDLTRAAAQYQEVLDLCRESGFVRGQAASLNNLGNIACQQGKLAEAEQFCREALAIYRRMEALDGQERALTNLGDVAHVRGDLETAERCHREALDLGRQLGAAVPQARALINLGSVAAARGDMPGAERCAREALHLSRAGSLPEFEAAALVNLGHVARRWGEWETAERHYRAALDVRRRIASAQGEAMAQCHLGALALMRGDPNAAEALLSDALTVARERGYRPVEACALQWQGELALWRLDLTAAAGPLNEALAIDREIGQRSSEAGTLRALAALAADQGDETTARRQAEEALAILRAIGDREGQPAALLQLAECTSELAEAFALAEAGLALARQLEDVPGQMAALTRQAALARRAGEFARAGRLAEEALALDDAAARRDDGHSTPARAAALLQRGRAALAAGDPDDARVTLLEALRLAVPAPRRAPVAALQRDAAAEGFFHHGDTETRRKAHGERRDEIGVSTPSSVYSSVSPCLRGEEAALPSRPPIEKRAMTSPPPRVVAETIAALGLLCRATGDTEGAVMHLALADRFYGALATPEAREAREALAALRDGDVGTPTPGPADTTGGAFAGMVARVAGLSLAEGAVWALSEGE